MLFLTPWCRNNTLVLLILKDLQRRLRAGADYKHSVADCGRHVAIIESIIIGQHSFLQSWPFHSHFGKIRRLVQVVLFAAHHGQHASIIFPLFDSCLYWILLLVDRVRLPFLATNLSQGRHYHIKNFLAFSGDNVPRDASV